MKAPLALWQRIGLGLLLPLAIILVCVYELRIGVGLQCWFYQLTGLYCPGCGSGRAVHALLQGQLRRAFGYNVLLFLLGVPCAAVVGHEYLRLVFPRLGLKPVMFPRALELVCLALVLGFWIARNIPALAFLAPA